MGSLSFGEQDDATSDEIHAALFGDQPVAATGRTSSRTASGSTSGGAMRAVDTNLLVRLTA